MRARQEEVGEAFMDLGTVFLLNHGALLGLTLLPRSDLVQVPLILILSTGLGIGAVSILHHGGHRRFSSKSKLNAACVQFAAPAGFWVSYWGHKHRIHHKATAIYPVDGYTTVIGLRLHPGAPWRAICRWQAYYVLLAYALYWVIDLGLQLRYLLSAANSSDPYPTLAHRWADFLYEKALFSIAMAPYAFIGGGRVLGEYVIAGIAGSAYAGLLVGIGHINVGLSPSAVDQPARSWTTHVLSTTASFSSESRFAGWLSGGLTLHTAHHLRPLYTRSQLREFHAGLQQRDNNIVEFDSFYDALKGHFAVLKLWGHGPDSERSQSDPSVTEQRNRKDGWCAIQR